MIRRRHAVDTPTKLAATRSSADANAAYQPAHTDRDHPEAGKNRERSQALRDQPVRDQPVRDQPGADEAVSVAHAATIND